MIKNVSVGKLDISPKDISEFGLNGFITKKNVLGSIECALLRKEFDRLFKGEFDKRTYPDEWYWRAEISKPDVTRHMSNAWKASYIIESIATNPIFGRVAATLGGWKKSRLAMDTLWWKPASAKAISYHQDTSFMDCFNPKRTITIWITLTATNIEVGTLEYAVGSHKWSLSSAPEQFHAPADHRVPMYAAASNANIEKIELYSLDLPEGAVSVHAGEIWHGSGINTSSAGERLSLGLHYMPHEAVFNEDGFGYIFRRYQRSASNKLDDAFFPVVGEVDSNLSD